MTRPPAANPLRTFFPDFVTILRSGLFMHSAYANRYLGARYHLPLALGHYLLVGEARGNRPHPFYDPLFAKTRGIAGLAAYLRRPALWCLPPSPLFDPAHYRATAPAGGNPLVDFSRRGFAADRDPSVGFDTAFFKRVVAFYRPDKAEFAFELMADPARPITGDEQAYKARADAFFAAIDLAVLRRPARRRRFLLFIQGGRAFANPYKDPARRFDVLLNDYTAPPVPDGSDPHEAGYDADFDAIAVQRGTKTTAIRKLLRDAPELLLGYDHVLFLDDDVRLSGADIERLFATVTAHGLDLAQASLTAGSACAFAVLKQPQAGAGLTPLTSVEIMMPVLSRRALRDCGWVFGEGISGWAVDFLLGAAVRARFGNTVALVGHVVAAHERPIDTLDGAFYRFLRAHGIEATTEAGRIAVNHGIEVSATAIRQHPEPLAPAG